MSFEQPTTLNPQEDSPLFKQRCFVQAFFASHPQAFAELSDEEWQLLHDIYLLEPSIEEGAEFCPEANPQVADTLNTAIYKVADQLCFDEDMKSDLSLPLDGSQLQELD